MLAQNRLRDLQRVRQKRGGGLCEGAENEELSAGQPRHVHTAQRSLHAPVVGGARAKGKRVQSLN